MPLSYDFSIVSEDVSSGVKLYVRVTPKSSVNSFCGFYQDGLGKNWLKVSVKAPPDGGKANQTLLTFLAKEGHFPKTSLSIINGISDRYKTILISGDQQKIRYNLCQMLS